MLGDLLRQAREQKNLSLNDVEQGTNIRKLYIKAIEDGEYEKLPGEVFLKGFIKAYARFLGLDGKTLIEQYKAEKNAEKEGGESNPAPAENKEAEEKSAEKPSPAEKTELSEAPAAKPVKKMPKNTAPAANVPKIGSFDAADQYLKTQSSGNKRNIMLLIILIIVIIGGAVFYLSLSQDSGEPKPSVPAVQQEQQAPQEQAAPPAAVSGSEVAAVFSQDCWVEVKVDGQVVLSETVKSGSSLSWKGAKQVDITVGNAGAVDITFNNQPQGKLGDVGAVVTKSFPAPDQAPAQNQQQ